MAKLNILFTAGLMVIASSQWIRLSSADTKCQQHLLATVNGPPGTYVPQCKENGEYESTQCHWSAGYCFCVDDQGNRQENTAVRAPNRPICDDTPCWQRLRDTYPTRIGAFIPECTETGLYKPVQFHGSTGHFFCVDPFGNEIEGTRTRNPDINC